jgi:hypothetical protein
MNTSRYGSGNNPDSLPGIYVIYRDTETRSVVASKEISNARAWDEINKTVVTLNGQKYVVVDSHQSGDNFIVTVKKAP